MKEFFLILFYSKVVLLTPAPVDVLGQMEIAPAEPLEAITRGANIQIDVSSYTGGLSLKNTGIVELRQAVRNKIPEGSVTATLYSAQGHKIELHDSGISLGPEDARLIFHAASGVPTDVASNRVVIASRVGLKGVKVFWQNYMH